MSAETSLLTDPHPCRHIVYPYNDEERAVNAVCLFASSGLSKGESVVLIMADSRCDSIIGRLSKAGCDLEALLTSGQLECISADSMLHTVIRDGLLNESLFKDTMSSVIERARASSPSRKVRIFGEMVSLLLARNQLSVAELLEGLWNELIETHSISLFCTYRLVDARVSMLPESLALLHSHNLAADAI
jgi:hypothetical protein